MADHSTVQAAAEAMYRDDGELSWANGIFPGYSGPYEIAARLALVAGLRERAQHLLNRVPPLVAGPRTEQEREFVAAARLLNAWADEMEAGSDE